MITTNINEVIARTQRLPARINEAMQRASAPLSWLDEARDLAHAVLMAQPPMEAVEAKTLFVRTVTSTLLAGANTGFVLGMSAPELNQFKDVLWNARDAFAAGGNALERATGLFARPISELNDVILEWVATPENEGGKRRDARDLGKSDEEIAGLISYIMLGNVGEKGALARRRLLPHIEEFIRLKMEQSRAGIDPATADLWLRAVLAAWRAWVPQRWLQRVREELKKP